MSDAAADAWGLGDARGQGRPARPAQAGPGPDGPGGRLAALLERPSCSFHGRRRLLQPRARFQSLDTDCQRCYQSRRHLSIVICGHVDSGKSTTTGRLLFELGGIPERELEKLKVRWAAGEPRSALQERADADAGRRGTVPGDRCKPGND